jgi:hypothetical protein
MTWIKRWGYEAKLTKAPGVMLMRDGRYIVHGNISEKGIKRKYVRIIDAESIREAQRERLAMLDEARQKPTTSMPLFGKYAPLLYARKVAQLELKSAKTRERWDTTLRLHLLPAFGRFPVDAIGKLDVESWKTRIAKRIASGQLSPRTANGWLSILRVVLRSAVDDFDLPKDPTLRVKDFSTAEHPTYTEEEPSLLASVRAGHQDRVRSRSLRLCLQARPHRRVPLDRLRPCGTEGGGCRALRSPVPHVRGRTHRRLQRHPDRLRLRRLGKAQRHLRPRAPLFWGSALARTGGQGGL